MIVAIARTRNEEDNIGLFCEHYTWADKILVADGGSEDRTKGVALTYPNVQVRDFPERIQMDNGLWRNPHGRHLNFLIDWAKDEGADWIIHDDVDSLPCKFLRYAAPAIFKDTQAKLICVTRLYLWGEHQFFPEMSTHGNPLWAFHVSSNVRFSEADPLKHEFAEPLDFATSLQLQPPRYCLLHRFARTPEIAQRKMEFYDRSGEIPNALHPLASCGVLMELPDWAK